MVKEEEEEEFVLQKDLDLEYLQGYSLAPEYKAWDVAAPPTVDTDFQGYEEKNLPR